MLTCLTEFSEQLYKKGLLEEGDEEASIDNARNLFKNGASFINGKFDYIVKCCVAVIFLNSTWIWIKKNENV